MGEWVGGIGTWDRRMGGRGNGGFICKMFLNKKKKEINTWVIRWSIQLYLSNLMSIYDIWCLLQLKSSRAIPKMISHVTLAVHCFMAWVWRPEDNHCAGVHKGNWFIIL